MQLNDEERQRLAQVLAERLTGFATRRATVDAAGLSDAQVAGEPVSSWRMVIDEALERGRFLQLLKAAARQAPGDIDLESLAEEAERGVLLLPEPPGPPPPWRTLAFGMAGALIIVALVVSIVTWMGAPDADAPPVPSVAAGDPPKVEVRAGLKEPPKPKPRPVAPAPPPDDPDDAIADPDDAPAVAARPGKFIRIPDPTPPPEPEPEPAPSPSPVAPAAGCTGYAYAGSARPDVVGGRWTVAAGANVRAYYPTAENGYDARGPVQCTLAAGVSVPAGPPIEVAGGAWWVPILGAP